MTTAAKPKPLRMKAPRVPEKAIQNGIVALLRMSGYTVLPLGMSKKPSVCPQCHTRHWGQQATQNPLGCPDLIITGPGWGRAWLALELKAADTKRRPEQIALVEAGACAFVTSDREAAADVLAFERRMGVAQNKRLSAWLDSDGG